MSFITGPKSIAVGALTNVDDSALNTVGDKVYDERGREYLYMKGVADTVQGSWVTYDELGVTALLAANAKGNVAVAMAAIIANK